MVIAAVLLFAGLGSPGLWEPWEMDRAFLASSLEAPKEVVAALGVHDGEVAAALAASAEKSGAVVQRPDAATAAGETTAYVRMALDMAKNRAAAAIVFDLSLLPPRGQGDEPEEAAARVLDEALRSAGLSPVVIIGAEAPARREALFLARTAIVARERIRPLSLETFLPDGTTLPQYLADAAAQDPDAARFFALLPTDTAALDTAIAQGVNAIAGIVQYRDNGTLHTFPPLETWLRAASFSVLGQTEFAARLPGVLLALAALAVLLGVLRLVFSLRVAIIAGLVMTTLPLFYDQARILAGEPGFMLGLTLAAAAMLLLTRQRPASTLGRYLPWAYLGLGMVFAVLSKGLFGLAVVAAMTLVDPIVRGARRLDAWVPAIIALAGTGFVALLVSGSTPGDFASQLSLKQGLFTDGPLPYFRSFDIIIKSLGFGLTPWSPVAVVAIGLVTFGAVVRQDRRALVIAGWFFIPALALMMTLKDFNHFVFAAAPAVAVAVALFADRIVEKGYRNAFIAVALVFMYFILRNELKISPEPLVASLTFDPPFSKDGQLRFPEGLELGFAFKSMLLLAAGFCVLHVGRLGSTLPRMAKFLQRERPFIMTVASTIVLIGIVVLSVVGRPHGRAMGSSYAELVGPGQKEFIRAFVSFSEPLMTIGIWGLILLTVLAVIRFKAKVDTVSLMARYPKLGVLGWGTAAVAFGALVISYIAWTDVPPDFWSETLLSGRALPGYAAGVIIAAAIYFLSKNRLEAVLAGIAALCLMLAIRFIRDTGSIDALAIILLIFGTTNGVGSFALRILPTPERFALGAAAFIALVLFAFAAPLLDRWSYLNVIMAQGGPVTSGFSLVVSTPALVLVALLVGLYLNARGRQWLARIKITPARSEATLQFLERGSTLVVALVVIGFVVTGINIFKFQKSFAVNVSQKHIIDTWFDAAGDGEDAARRIVRHGSFGPAGGRDTNFYTSGFAEVKDRNSALRLLRGHEDLVTPVETRDGTEYRVFPGFSAANDKDGDGKRDVAVIRGVATEVADGRLTDRSQAWQPGALKGQILYDAVGQSWTIKENDATSVTVADSGRWPFALKPAQRAFFTIASAPLGDARATGAHSERRALLIPAESLSEINYAWRQMSGGEQLPILEGSSYRVLLATSFLKPGEAQQNRLALATYNDETFAALKRPNLRRVWGSYEDIIQAVGFDVDKPVVGGNEKVALTIYYKVLKPLNKSMQIFLHLDRLGASNRIHGDHWPLNPTRLSDDNKSCTGCFRTDHWMVGDIIADTYEIEIPEGSSAGDYMIWVGFFQPGPDTRLKVTRWDEKNCKHDGVNRLGLGTITVR